MYLNLILIASALLIYSILAGRIEKTAISGPMLFVLLGLVSGPLLLDVLDIELNQEGYKTLAEVALSLMLFTDASNTNFQVLEHNIATPLRLLIIGLPLTIVLGLLAGLLVFTGFSWIELAILATILAPTDAALGNAVVTNKAVPSRIREALKVESGFNDGIAVPVLLLFMALFEAGASGEVSLGFGLGLFVREIGIGMGTGLAVAYIGTRLIHHCNTRKWITASLKPFVIISLTLCCFSLAQLLGGSGFIACFAGGLLYGRLSKNKAQFLISAEGSANILSLITWIIFGAVVVSDAISGFTWQIGLYTVLSLTIVRMLPVYLSQMRTGIAPREKYFMGWFGPRGLASVVFAIIILDLQLPHQETIISTIVCTILASVFLHGLSAKPIIKRLYRPIHEIDSVNRSK